MRKRREMHSSLVKAEQLGKKLNHEGPYLRTYTYKTNHGYAVWFRDPKFCKEKRHEEEKGRTQEVDLS